MPQKQYRRILVPLDGSKLAEQVLPHATSLARLAHAEIVLAHVVPAEGKRVRPPTPSQQKAMEDIGSYLKDLAERLSKQEKVPVGWRVTSGDPVEDLVRFISEGDVDLVAMSTRGQGGRGAADLGSVAQRIVERVAIVPVLLIKPEGTITAL
jgi:nucleotide-binding universal stress UspA family protein